MGKKISHGRKIYEERIEGTEEENNNENKRGSIIEY